LEPLQVAERLKESFPEEVLSIDEFRGQVHVTVRKNKILEIAKYLNEEPELNFDYLRDLCGVDYLGKKNPRFEVVYQLFSHKHKHMIRLKAQVPEEGCSIKSVVSVWKAADWNERECYDLFGIKFEGHPDHRRILLPEDWEGHPLRKDYPVEGPSPENEWDGFKKVLEKSNDLKKYEWNN
jgi:NADH-quinone oxidoreductase subunit C